MNRQISFMLLACISLICGCGITKREPDSQDAYLLNVQRPDNTVLNKTDCLYIRPCRAANPYAGRNFIYRLSPVQYEQDYYNQFLTTPDIQVDEILALWFRDSGISTCASTVKHTENVPLTLVPRLDVLCVDFQEAGKPKAVIQMYFKLMQQEKNTNAPVVVLKKSYSAQSSLPPVPSGTQITEAMSLALTDILTQMEKDVSEVLK